MTSLSQHFTLEEMTFSSTALRYGIDNSPPAAQTSHLASLCNDLLEDVRALLMVPLHVDSGYRCPQLNALVRGAKDSAHMDGRAADIVPQGMSLQDAFNMIKQHSDVLPLDQCIIECGAWIHLAIAADGSAPRKQFLTGAWLNDEWVYNLV